MRSIKCACVMLALFGTAVLDAGQVYGTIVSEGKGVQSANIEIKCGDGRRRDRGDGRRRRVPHQRDASRGSARSRSRATWAARPRRSSPARIPASTTSTS